MSRKMKESGIPYIGLIPDDWNIFRVKDKYKLQTGFTPDTKNEEYYDPDGFEWVTIGDITDEDSLSNSTKKKVSKLYLDEHPQMYSPKGSLLYSFKLSVGQTAFANRDVYTNEAIATFLNSEDINLDFLKYSSSLIVGNANENIYGAKILNQDLIRTAPIVFPSLDEQTKIANFLNEKVNHINKLIKIQKNQIEKLNEFKTLYITECTLGKKYKGLKKSVDGSPWMGYIPDSWECKPFKYTMFERNEKNSPVISKERLSLSIDLGITLYKDKTTNLDRFKDDFSQYKIAHEGDLVFNSMNMIVGAVGYSNWTGCVSPVYYTFYDNDEDHITAKYYDFLFHCKPIRKVLYCMGKGIYSIDRGDDKINTCRLKVSREDLGTLIVPVPSKEEMHLIVDDISKKNKKIDSLISLKNKKILKYEEYKKSLIYEYVTGKKEVIA